MNNQMINFKESSVKFIEVWIGIMDIFPTCYYYYLLFTVQLPLVNPIKTPATI